MTAAPPLRDPNPLPPDSFRGRLLWLRMAMFFVFTLVLSCITFFLGMFLILFDPDQRRPCHWLIRIWSRIVLWVCGVKLVVEGLEHVDASKPCLLVGNHASWFDPPSIWMSYPGQCRFVMKRELGLLPFVGWYVKFTKHHLINRDSARSAATHMRQSKRDAETHGISTAIFPEGTRSDDGRLQELKAGSFQFALDAGMPVQPVAVLGSYAVWSRSTLAPRDTGTITLRYGPPISTEGLKGSRGRRAMQEQVRAALLALGVPDRISTPAD
ncbi:MAG: 1-acyl-sn-glycerol-3-phosphate acyltransferase [bacterium]|nr:1-acyl-sn-glycerol-3-phosphate acyltransferase [bacterium]